MNEAKASSRIIGIDVVRGVALVAMMIFHGAWDVSFLRLVRFDPGASIGWTVFARVIAGTFLFVAGTSLVLATRNGIRWPAYWRRLAMVVAAAATVSVATYFVMPEGWVFFGILHQIALASVLALPFLRLPPWTTLIVAALVFVIPFAFRSAIFATPALWWVGLSPLPPITFDYVPLFPWFGVVLAGVAVARFCVDNGFDVALARWQPRFALGRGLAWAGRHSLAVYLIHQPVLYGLLFLVAHVLMPDAPARAARADCVDRCVAVRDDPVNCAAYCGCVFEELDTSGLIRPLLDNALTPVETGQLQDMARVCTASTLPPIPPAPSPDAETPPDDSTGSKP